MVLLLFILMAVYVLYWALMEYFFYKRETHVPIAEYPFCSVVICAFNEEENIQKCLHSILNQQGIERYAEIIVIDDGSQDNTYQEALRTLQNSAVSHQIYRYERNMGKKQCIEHAIRMSHPESTWIILRDADTWTFSDKWFLQLIGHMSASTDFIVAPVVPAIQRYTLTEFFQYYEGLALMHLTYASTVMRHPILCNGANMAFRKEKFLQLNPYQDNKLLATGDDIFLLKKMRQNHARIRTVFSSESMVFTHAPPTFYAIIKQKLRWISKTTRVADVFNILSVLTIILGNSLFIPLAILSWKLCLIIYFLKLGIDWKILFSVRQRLQIREFSYFYFFIAELLYIPYVWALILGHFSPIHYNDRRNIRTT